MDSNQKKSLKMECGGKSNQQHKYSTRASTSGIVIQESNNAAATNIGGNLNPQRQTFKREADQYMPIANIIRIMRSTLPTNAKIADDAKEAVQECASEFISFITSEANERCHRDYRKTVTPEDVLAAMGTLGFDDYIEPLTVFLNKLRAQDPERSSMDQLRFFRRDRSFTHQPPAAQMARQSPPPPLPLTTVYRPLLPPPATHEVDYSEYVGLPKMMNNGYFFSNQGGGGGSSSSMEFDPFGQFK